MYNIRSVKSRFAETYQNVESFIGLWGMQMAAREPTGVCDKNSHGCFERQCRPGGSLRLCCGSDAEVPAEWWEKASGNSL